MLRLVLVIGNLPLTRLALSLRGFEQWDGCGEYSRVVECK